MITPCLHVYMTVVQPLFWGKQYCRPGLFIYLLPQMDRICVCTTSVREWSCNIDLSPPSSFPFPLFDPPPCETSGEGDALCIPPLGVPLTVILTDCTVADRQSMDRKNNIIIRVNQDIPVSQFLSKSDVTSFDSMAV